MKTDPDTKPRAGLSVPVLTILDADGKLIESDQRALVRHVIQDGAGADIVFCAGTTGEWDRIDNAMRQRVIRICCDEVASSNVALGPTLHRPVESWAGVTAPTRAETLENLACAAECGADAAVVAPLSISDVSDPVEFVARDVADALDAGRCRIPIYLYDNADIAIDPDVPHIRTRAVKTLSRLDFVRGIKVSGPRKVLGNYTKAAAGFRAHGDFGIYVGHASLIFDLFRVRAGVFGGLADRWNRRRLRGGLPVGVVSGPANVLPREWARAWQVCRAGDAERMATVRSVVDAFRDSTYASGGRRTIACLKRALELDGVTTSAAVADGTPPLSRPDRDRFDVAWERVRQLARRDLPAAWQTPRPSS